MISNENRNGIPRDDEHRRDGDLLLHPQVMDGPAETRTETIPVEEPPASKEDSTADFATRAKAAAQESVGKSRLLLLGSGLLVAVLFFVFTAIVGKSHRGPVSKEHGTQQAKQAESPRPKGSVTPVMETVHSPAPDNAAGQLAPGDIRRTRTVEARASSTQATSVSGQSHSATTTASLGGVPSFADTQQKWEEPRPYGEESATTTAPLNQANLQNGLKEPSLVFVHSVSQSSAMPAKGDSQTTSPFLEVTPGTRIQAKLETQISSAVLAPVVAVVEYTYQIGDRIVVPAGARVYGQLQQADRNGFVSVKFDEIELNGNREKIDAVGTGLDLGPIRGDVFGKNNGKNFLVRAGSGIGSVLAEIAGNNTSAAFSEQDMLRERVAENIGTAGDAEVMNLNANSHIVVSVPADTKIFIVFTKHEQQSQAATAKMPAATP